MIKRVINILCILVLFVVNLNVNKNINAQDKHYNTYSYINVDKGKLIKDMDTDTLNKHLNEVSNRLFLGWNIKKINENVHATFISDVLFSYKNEGSTPLTYKLNISSETSVKTSVSSTGTISCDVSGGNKTFKGGLSEQLKLSDETTKTELCKSQEALEIVVDPHTVVSGYIQGEGTYTNGVAASYAFWICGQMGWFEYFTISSSYLRIEKVSL